MKRTTIILSLVLFLCTLHTRSYSQEFFLASASSLAAEIAQSNSYEISPTIGLTRTPSQQYQRFKRLVSIANEQELVDLASNHTNAVVRLYAFQALKARKADISKALLEKFRNDNTKVHVVDGRIIQEKTVDFLAQRQIFSSTENKLIAFFN